METVWFAFSALPVISYRCQFLLLTRIILPFPTMSASKDQDFTKWKLNGSVVSFKKPMD